MARILLAKDGMKEVIALIKSLDDATSQFQRNTGRKPDAYRLQELLWQVIDPSAKID